MSNTTTSLRRKIQSAGDLQSVVRTMKAMAASSIGQYERSVRAIEGYAHTVELGLSACLRELGPADAAKPREDPSEGDAIGAIVFGSDQGLVGRFNAVVAEYARETLAALPGAPQIWAVGERVHASLVDVGLPVMARFAVPSAVGAIAPLVGRIQLESESHRAHAKYAGVYVFHNRTRGDSLHEPVHQRLLPLDDTWRGQLACAPWPTPSPPELLGGAQDALGAFIQEHLFISLFRACAESLTSENASRLAAMQRADKTIDELLVELRVSFHRLRQRRIDEELFDVIAGYDASTPSGPAYTEEQDG